MLRTTAVESLKIGDNVVRRPARILLSERPRDQALIERMCLPEALLFGHNMAKRRRCRHRPSEQNHRVEPSCPAPLTDVPISSCVQVVRLSNRTSPKFKYGPQIVQSEAAAHFLPFVLVRGWNRSPLSSGSGSHVNFSVPSPADE